jgi:hypothetical protein
VCLLFLFAFLGFGLIIIDFLLFQFSLDPIHGLVVRKAKQQGTNKGPRQKVDKDMHNVFQLHFR